MAEKLPLVPTAFTAKLLVHSVVDFFSVTARNWIYEKSSVVFSNKYWGGETWENEGDNNLAQTGKLQLILGKELVVNFFPIYRLINLIKDFYSK